MGFVAWLRRSRTAVLASGLISAGGCTVDPDGNPIPSPDEDAIYVFYPSGSQVSEGLVRGRGLPGAMPEEATHALIESHPTGHSVVRDVRSDGAFDFRIVAISGDVLEIRAATSASADEVGAPVFLRVPASIEPSVRFVCCQEQQTCQSIFEFEADVPCPTPTPATPTCTVNSDCAVFEGEYLPLREDQVSVSAPEGRTVRVEGEVLPNVLVTLANLGKSAFAQDLDPDQARRLGLNDPGVRLTRISDDQGRFVFEDVPATGDDEIVVQLFELNGFRSPPYALRVPDPELAGVDVLGVFPWEPLTNGRTGQVAVRLSLFGANGRGICPDAAERPDDLELCAGGGLEHGMVNFVEAQLDSRDDPGFSLAPVATATNAITPYNRGIEGNVRSDPLDLFLVLDQSADAAAQDPNRRTIQAARSYVRYLRQRDRVGIVTFGASVDVDAELTLDRNQIDARLDALASEAWEGDSTLLEAVGTAASLLENRNTSTPGRIVVIAYGTPTGTPEDARNTLNDVLDVVERRPRTGFEGFPVDVIGVQVSSSAETFRVLEDLATFSLGELRIVEAINQLDQTLADLRGEQVGSFILLYDMEIPTAVGKEGQAFLTVQVEIPGSPMQETTYEGPLRIANAPNP